MVALCMAMGRKSLLLIAGDRPPTPGEVREAGRPPREGPGGGGREALPEGGKYSVRSFGPKARV